MSGQALAAGTEYLKVFQIVGATALLGYAGAGFAYPIWYFFRWPFAFKSAVDGVVCSLATAGVFGWLWPM